MSNQPPNQQDPKKQINPQNSQGSNSIQPPTPDQTPYNNFTHNPYQTNEIPTQPMSNYPPQQPYPQNYQNNPQNYGGQQPYTNNQSHYVNNQQPYTNDQQYQNNQQYYPQNYQNNQQGQAFDNNQQYYPNNPHYPQNQQYYDPNQQGYNNQPVYPQNQQYYDPNQAYQQPYQQQPYQQQPYQQQPYQQYDANQQSVRQGIDLTELKVKFEPTLASPLCYLLFFVSGLYFLFTTEKDSRLVRFHAMQSIFFSAAWFVFYLASHVIYFAFSAFFAIIGLPIFLKLFTVFSNLVFLFLFGAWLMAMFKAYKGEHWKLPYIGDMAEKHIDSLNR